ncbi:hypothetical protein D3C71_1540090 [compost metagenome]
MDEYGVSSRPAAKFPENVDVTSDMEVLEPGSPVASFVWMPKAPIPANVAVAGTPFAVKIYCRTLA